MYSYIQWQTYSYRAQDGNLSGAPLPFMEWDSPANFRQLSVVLYRIR